MINVHIDINRSMYVNVFYRKSWK